VQNHWKSGRPPPGPGLRALITDLLYRNGISLLDVFYGYEDLLLLVEQRFGPRVYEILSKEISA